MPAASPEVWRLLGPSPFLVFLSFPLIVRSVLLVWRLSGYSTHDKSTACKLSEIRISDR